MEYKWFYIAVAVSISIIAISGFSSNAYKQTKTNIAKYNAFEKCVEVTKDISSCKITVENIK